MRGTFRRDLELRPDPRAPGALQLRRRWGPRLLSLAAVALGGGFAAADLLWFHRPVVAALTLAAALSLLLLHLRAEVESWRFDGDAAVRRSLELKRLRVREERLPARQIQRIGVATGGRRARAWLETRSGEQWALVEGDEAEVQRIADDFARAVRLASAERPRGLLH